MPFCAHVKLTWTWSQPYAGLRLACQPQTWCRPFRMCLGHSSKFLKFLIHVLLHSGAYIQSPQDASTRCVFTTDSGTMMHPFSVDNGVQSRIARSQTLYRADLLCIVLKQRGGVLLFHPIGDETPAMRRKSVVFPAPLLPTRPTTSPERISRLI